MLINYMSTYAPLEQTQSQPFSFTLKSGFQKKPAGHWFENISKRFSPEQNLTHPGFASLTKFTPSASPSKSVGELVA